jgi:hypothetical protein
MTLNVRPFEKHGTAGLHEGNNPSGLPVLDGADGFLESLGDFLFGDVTLRLGAAGLGRISSLIRVWGLIA